jgi:histidinol dehydrogenase
MRFNTLKLNTKEKDFEKKFLNRIRIKNTINTKAQNEVSRIISNIQKKGDKSLVSYISKLDNFKIKNIKEIIVSKKDIAQAYKHVSKIQINNLKKAVKRITNFSKKQLSSSWSFSKDNTVLGEKITPINSVGIYVPGGKASYPSTVLMNTLPAKVAGVRKIFMASPINNIEDHALAIVAADLCGVDKIFRMGGAHAIASLTYGTKNIPAVDKIVGPGNIYVSLAKKNVYGDVGIDNIAGPSEVVIIADKYNNPDWVALDLFSQAEHDELAQPILISNNQKFIDDVELSIKKLLPLLLRKKIITKSFKSRGMFIKANSNSEISDIVNKISPEHLEIMTKNYKSFLKTINNAGAIFLGQYSPEVFGDYCAGPNHVLPTSGSAKFSSPLGVYDFQKRSSIINISKKTAKELSKISVSLALAEGLQAHALAAKLRED